MLYTYRVSKYDPDDRDEHGRYLGAEDTDSDHGVVESAYLRAVADQYVYIGADHACERALSHTHTLGLFAERLTASPYDAVLDDEPGAQRPADDTFWTQLRRHLATHRAVILEEGYVVGASRWHRITDDTIDAVRAELIPRSRLTVWPDLSGNVEEVLAGLPAEGLIELIWEDEHGRINSTIADDTESDELATQVARAQAATALSVDVDERCPLFAAVLPDSDGVLRARWRTEAARGDSG